MASLFQDREDPPVDRLDLNGLAAAAKSCRACRLCLERKNVVWARGNPEARTMLVGQNPGKKEDETGLPFVGPAGELLDRILAAAGIHPDGVYITNVVKCWTPKNREPRQDETSACIERWLVRQVDRIRPALIVPLGAIATRALLGPEVAITRAHGIWTTWKGYPCFPMFHPAHLLWAEGEELRLAKKAMWDDVRELRRGMDSLAGEPQATSLKPQP